LKAPRAGHWLHEGLFAFQISQISSNAHTEQAAIVDISSKEYC
jgi:hypothetical protein